MEIINKTLHNFSNVYQAGTWEDPEGVRFIKV